jgi:hypothetical protein
MAGDYGGGGAFQGLNFGKVQVYEFTRATYIRN